MRWIQAAVAGLWLLQQTQAASGIEHLRWQRPVELQTAHAAPACAVLDAPVFAHASALTLDDLRLYAQTASGSDASVAREVPFTLTINSAAPTEVEHATAANIGVHQGRLEFDLRMPARPYSEVNLQLAATNFIATADVTAADSAHPAAAPRKLGSFTLFDLSAQHLARSTTLALEEATLPTLHVTLALRTPEGKRIDPATSLIHGAEVPPSRVAQTLFTTIASTTDLTAQGRSTEAVLHVPAHVPVERVRLALDPGFHANFVRRVSISAYPGPSLPHAGRLDTPPGGEHVEGEISREQLSLRGAAPVRQEHLAVDALLAATLRKEATVHVTLDNGSDVPLPLRAVELQMRQRRLCFTAQPGLVYTLRYGDPGLPAPSYDTARVFDPVAAAATAMLGPESLNPQWTPRPLARPFAQQHPELPWVALLGFIAVLGAIAIGSMKHQRRTR